MDYISRVVEDEIDSGKLAGASVAIWKSGEMKYRKDFGYMDIENKIPMPQDGIFRLYSSTKPITAAAVMILFERGMIDLCDPVSKYLNGFSEQTVYKDGKTVKTEKQITLSDLLNMTSGLVYPDSDPSGRSMAELFDNGVERALSGNGFSTVEFCNNIGKIPLAFEPGTNWRYGTSADVLGAVIEVAAKKPFSQFLKEEIFIPLEMNDTDFYVPQEKRNRQVKMYEYSNGSLNEYTGNHLLILSGREKPAFESGGAGLFSTMADYAAFSNMLLNNGKYKDKRILGRKTVEFMRSNQLTDDQRKGLWGDFNGYGYGCLMRNLNDIGLAKTNGSKGEFGWGGWAGTYATMDVLEDMIIEIFISRVGIDNDALHRRIRSVIYGQID